MKLYTKVAQLNRVGGVFEKRLRHLKIEMVEDLLYYFPFRYEDYSQVVDIANLVEGQEVTVRGKIELIASKRSPRKRTVITEAVVTDETEQLRIVWFGQPFITKTLKVGDEVFFSGKVKTDMFGVQMVSPSYEKVNKNSGTVHTARIVPMYPLTSGITQKQLRFLMAQAVKATEELVDWLPEDIRDRVDVMGLSEAIKAIHFPESEEEFKHAERRLKFDELFVLQLRAEMIRQSIKSSRAPKLEFKEKEVKEFVETLPFTLTKDQKVSAWEIFQDIEKEEPMNRLLEGDVGSGKTVVAAMGLYNTFLNGAQGIIMAPTEILAKQHFETLKEIFGEKVRIGILTRTEYKILNFEFENNSKTSQKKEIIKQIGEGEVDIIVGTHALLTDDLEFKNLGLVIVDEQHRFGVDQRKTIREKSGDPDTVPHFLSMTATPIPRSFALTLYGDLDLSIIRQTPSGRKSIKTRLVDSHNRSKAYRFIKDQVKQGRQVFVICPLIEEKSEGTGLDLPTSSGTEKKTVMAEYEKLSKHIFPDLKIGYLHGKMKGADKDSAMEQFKNGSTNILVSTSVVEVGVDIPNASVMMIEGAERFGLAQLHQFRGRVGRSSHQSYCFLFTDSNTQKAQERLKLFESTTDGFKLAEHDLELRGPGEVYGMAQSGMMHLRLATLSDKELIKLAREVSRGIDFEKYPGLYDKVGEWEDRVHLE
ncbi:ATP-dependent DNA helicase RecG [Candidatus Parcubacteria bacterium]|jgi:ATP-dependent DNA helicase RecG|nr:ATP-dependent DNA helicase RecG [Candidatus Parcubacteria bacterium]MBT3949053.1 ATP-dependent DNA helicase RecG [Candidatus Parcubacteria bacterium]